MANIGFDHFNKFILHDEADINITVQEIYDKSVDEMDFPHIAMTTGVILTASGKDALGGSEFTGVTMVLRNGWTFKCRTVPAGDITVKISGGNTIAEGSNDRFTHVDNVHYEFGQSTAPALIVTAGVITPTQQEIRDSMTLNRLDPVLAGSVDDKLNEMLKLAGNNQDWISPGLLRIFADGQPIGGTTFAEFETRDTGGVQTFDITKVRQFIRIK